MIDYDGKMRILQIDTNSSDSAVPTLKFDHEQTTYFGRSSAIAYKDATTEAESHIYIGGAVDNKSIENNANNQEWGPAIFHLDYNVLGIDMQLITDNGNWSPVT